ncbi:hypothetical protein PHISCL_10778, partial [Aspergillus sclerotialis]
MAENHLKELEKEKAREDTESLKRIKRARTLPKTATAKQRRQVSALLLDAESENEISTRCPRS